MSYILISLLHKNGDVKMDTHYFWYQPPITVLNITIGGRNHNFPPNSHTGIFSL